MQEPDQEFTREILRKVRQIEIKSNRLISEVLSGSYQSAFKGQGIDFEEVRDYQPGDEVRSIDWNVTAKMGNPFVKQYREERELTILLAIDISESGIFGSGNRSKRERMAEILFFKNRTKLTNLNEGLRFINKVMRRRAVVFFLSDFIIPELPNEEEVEEQMEDLFYKEISSTKKRHDLICAQVGDPCEFKLPSTGLTTFEDAESGELITIDLSNQKCRAEFEENVFARQNNFAQKLKRRGIDFFKFSTNIEFDKALKEFFHLRKSRRR